MVMSETSGLAAHQMHPRLPRCNAMVQPSLIVNRLPLPSGDSCTILNDNNNSRNDASRTFIQCVGCGGQIYDRYILRVSPDLEWHADCLKCEQCKRQLDETCTCFVRNGKTYCKDDYVRLFSAKCDKCGNVFNKSDFVMKAKNKIYHVDCFRCCACTRQLVPGEEFALKENGAIYCKEDNEFVENSTGQTPSASGLMPVVYNQNSSINSNTETNNNISLINQNSSSANSLTEIGCVSDSSSENGSHKGSGSTCNKQKGGNTNSDGRPTRVRTVLNEKQLQTLRTCYAANPRPDALMKEQLVELTKLSPRVIRVWFQNKRCKDKKKSILMKQQHQQEKDGRNLRYACMQGIPMIATSPIRHDSPQGLHPIDVQRYQPPWRTLNEFALRTDLNQNNANNNQAIHHLINQMHGYELPQNAIIPDQTNSLIMPNVPQTDSLTHPDSTDSFVTFMESDESLQSDP